MEVTETLTEQKVEGESGALCKDTAQKKKKLELVSLTFAITSREICKTHMIR